MSTTPSPTVGVEDRPDVGEVWEPASVFLHNWHQNGVSLETEFETSVIKPPSLAEERRGLRSRPQRTMGVQFDCTKDLEWWNLEMLAHRLADYEGLMPLYCDMTEVVSPDFIGVTHADVRYRRFFSGGRVIAVSRRNAAMQAGVRVFAISTPPGPDIISLIPTPNPPLDVGDRLYPAIETRLLSQQWLEPANRRTASGSFTVTEKLGLMTLPALDLPDDWPVYRTYPVLNVVPAWVRPRIGVQRFTKDYPSGRDHEIVGFGDRPGWAFDTSWQKTSRAEIWPLIQFLESRRGRLLPFWFPHPMTCFRPISLSGASLGVRRNGTLLDYSRIADVAIVTRQGDLITRRINGVSRGTDEDTLILDSAPGLASVSEIARVGPLMLCRRDSDAHRELWRTMGQCTASCPIVEIRPDKEIVLEIGCPATDPIEIADAVTYLAWVGVYATDTEHGMSEGDPCESIQNWNPAGGGSGSGTNTIDADAWKKRVAFWHAGAAGGTTLSRVEDGTLTNNPNEDDDRPIFNDLPPNGVPSPASGTFSGVNDWEFSFSRPSYGVQAVSVIGGPIACCDGDYPYWEWPTAADPWKVASAGSADPARRREMETSQAYLYSVAATALQGHVVPSWHNPFAGFTLFIAGGNCWFSPTYYESQRAVDGACGSDPLQDCSVPEGLSLGVYDTNDDVLLEVTDSWSLRTGGLDITGGPSLSWTPDGDFHLWKVECKPGSHVKVWRDGILVGEDTFPGGLAEGSGYRAVGPHTRVAAMVVIPRILSECEENEIGRWLADHTGMYWSPVS